MRLQTFQTQSIGAGKVNVQGGQDVGTDEATGRTHLV